MASAKHGKAKATIGKFVEFRGTVPYSLRKALSKLDGENQALITQGLEYPIGCLDFVKESIAIQDERTEGSLRPVVLPSPKTTPKDFQLKAIEELVAQDNGYLVGPTGSGKTLIVFLLISQLGCRMLFVTHRVELVRQVATMFYDEFHEVAGFVGEGERVEGKTLTVAVAQSIVRNPLSDSYGILYTDECHHAMSDTYLRIIRQYSAKYKYGGTGTLSRSNGRAKLFPFILGKHQVEIPLSETLELVNLPDVVFRYTKCSGATEEFCSKYFKKFEEKALTQEIRSDKILRFRLFTFLCGWVDKQERNKLVAEDVNKLLKAGLQSIGVFTNRKKHAEHIAELLRNQGAPVFTCIGKLKGDTLDTFRMFGGALVGTESLLGEGVNLPQLQAICLASPAGGRGKVAQRLGRLMRGSGRKYLIDYVDEDEYSLQLHYARRNVYKKMRLSFRKFEDILRK